MYAKIQRIVAEQDTENGGHMTDYSAVNNHPLQSSGDIAEEEA